MAIVVLMAGGRGLRLHPLTEKIPKPMLHVGDKPIIQQIMEGFLDQGFNRFVFCVGYKAEVIRGYFGNGKQFGAEISYIQDPAGEPMGTAGALRFIGLSATSQTIVQNADILTHVDYSDLLKFHSGRNADATMCAANHMYQVPYGVLNIAGDYMIAPSDEKPIKSWPVNAGIYVLSERALAAIPEGASDMPDLLDRLPTVAVYQISNHWTDVGTFESLDRARAIA